MKIHPTAIVDPSAELSDVAVGPYCIIEADVRIGPGTVVESHATVKAGTTIGRSCHIFPGAVLGHLPQDARFMGEGSTVMIGDHNIIREYVTIHRATEPGGKTVIGDHNMLMAYCHIGHDVKVGSHVVIASYGGISGHVTLEDYVNLGGMVGIHQWVHVGKLAFIGGMTKVTQDIPPFMIAEERRVEITGLNVVGLRRCGVPSNERKALRQAYRLMYRSGLNRSQALERIEKEVSPCESVDYLVQFMRRIPKGSKGRQDEPGDVAAEHPDSDEE